MTDFERLYGPLRTTIAKAVFSLHPWASGRSWDDLAMDDQEGFYEVAAAVDDALGLVQVGWADCSEGLPSFMNMHFKAKVPSLWSPVYVTSHSGRSRSEADQ